PHGALHPGSIPLRLNTAAASGAIRKRISALAASASGAAACSPADQLSITHNSSPAGNNKFNIN
ncbi:MAG TPA: hypothetical protein VNO32_63510, partial [Candidatus Acidoferrum sp.]|nr:hypothetical protein [Candidatus Acidoferrum sp.]